MAATTADALTVSVPSKSSDAEQQSQVTDLVFGLERLLRRRRGFSTAYRWRKDIDKFLTTSGVTYEQIRSRLESDFNLELILTKNELMQIISP